MSQARSSIKYGESLASVLHSTQFYKFHNPCHWEELETNIDLVLI